MVFWFFISPNGWRVTAVVDKQVGTFHSGACRSRSVFYKRLLPVRPLDVSV